MSDHTDDGFPRERYEGPMASLPGTLSVPLSPYIKPALGLGASGLPLDPMSGLHPDPKDATIAEQLAEIERLKGQLASCADQRQRLNAERDRLRLEVDRQQNLNFEAQDRYAALEAERDEARRASETVHSHYVLALKQRDEAVANTRAECDKGYEALFQAHQRVVAERDELKRKLDEAEKEIAHMRESNGRADDYSAKLERVIEATNVNAGAMVNLLIAMANAGLPMPGPVPLPPEDAKS